MNVRLTAVAVAALLSAPVLAQAQPAAKPLAAEKMICRVTPVLGSRTQFEKSCRSEREWADLKLQTQQKIEQMQQRGLQDGR